MEQPVGARVSTHCPPPALPHPHAKGLRQSGGGPKDTIRSVRCVCSMACGSPTVSRVVLAAGALREDRRALYPYMACHGASPYRREVPPLIFVYSLGIGDTYGGPRSWLCGRASVPHSPESVGVGCGWWAYNSLVINILVYKYINSSWPCFNTRCSN